MKKTIITSVVAFALLWSACNNSTTESDSNKSESNSLKFNFDTTELKTGQLFYQCEMHPEVISNTEGKCPECDMELSEIEKH